MSSLAAAAAASLCAASTAHLLADVPPAAEPVRPVGSKATLRELGARELANGDMTSKGSRFRAVHGFGAEVVFPAFFGPRIAAVGLDPTNIGFVFQDDEAEEAWAAEFVNGELSAGEDLIVTRVI